LDNTMKVVRLHGPGELRVSEEPVPEYGPAEVLLRIRAVGICASDVHYYKDGGIGDAVVRDPLVLGHEVGAEVAEVGSDVTFLRTGDRVQPLPEREVLWHPSRGWSAERVRGLAGTSLHSDTPFTLVCGRSYDGTHGCRHLRR